MKAKLERKIEEKKHTYVYLINNSNILFQKKFSLTIYQKKQIDIEKEEKIAHEKEMKIHEDKMHKLNTLVKELEVIHLQLTKTKNPIELYYFL
jgi:hypothetical protein